MTSALVFNNGVVEFYPGDVPGRIFLPDASPVVDVHCVDVGWSGGGYSILPASYTDTQPAPTSYSIGNNFSISSGPVQVTRTWVTPPPSVPPMVTNAQARYVLMQTTSPVNSGKTLLDDADAAVTAAGGVDRMAWEYSNYLNRNSSLVASMATAISLGSTQVDDLFIAAAQITF